MDITSPERDFEISQEEMDKLDDDLLEIEILYKTRCVNAPAGNVIVREIEKKDE